MLQARQEGRERSSGEVRVRCRLIFQRPLSLSPSPAPAPRPGLAVPESQESPSSCQMVAAQAVMWCRFVHHASLMLLLARERAQRGRPQQSQMFSASWSFRGPRAAKPFLLGSPHSWHETCHALSPRSTKRFCKGPHSKDFGLCRPCPGLPPQCKSSLRRHANERVWL